MNWSEISINELVDDYKNIPWGQKEIYGNYLAQTYHFVKHSTRLLATAAGRMSAGEDKLFRRFTHHISEEQSHERLAEKDLHNMNLSILDFTESSITKAFYQSQYYQIEHISPFCLLGYILMLETVGVYGCPTAYSKARDVFGEKSALFLKVHADEDPGHVEKALESIVSLPNDVQSLIYENYCYSRDIFKALIREICGFETVGAHISIESDRTISQSEQATSPFALS